MRLLLDTHVYLWAVMNSRLLGASARRAIETAEEVYVSAASIWEIAIKARLGKIEASPDDLAGAIVQSGFIELPIRASHAAEVGRLPLHHGDPFDRILIAQAVCEPLRLLTADSLLTRYGDLVMLA